MTTVLEKKIVIGADDLTGKAFAAIEKRIDALSKASKRLSGGVAGKLDLIGGMSNFDSRTRSAEMISRMSTISRSAEKASSSLGGLGKSLSGLRTVIAPFIALKVKDFAGDVIHTFREFDKERRYARAVMGISDNEQKPLVDQAIHGGATSKYNDIQWLEAQRALAGRGLNTQQILALTKVAANLGQAMDLTLPEASTVLEGGMFGFGKKTSTYEEAVAGAQRTADLQVKASKAFGMSPDDIREGYKFAAAPFHLGGLSEETMLAFLGLGKKANMGGDEMGTAGRAVIANLLKPTSGARTAMMASGIDYSKYQNQGSRPMDANNFAKSIAATYGVELDKAAKASLQHVFNNKAVVADAAKFMPAIMNVLGDALSGDDAKSKKSIAAQARHYRDASMSGVNTDKLFTDLMVAMAHNPALANVVFGSKQGSRIMTALGDPKLFMKKLDELKNHSQGYAEKIAEERMAGFDGAMSRLEGSTKNLETSFGRANDVFLTPMTNEGARFVQTIAEMDSKVHLMIEAFGAAAVAIGLFEAALKGAAVMQNMSGNPASAGAIAGLGGGAAGRMGWLGAGLGAVGAGYIGNEIYKNYNAMDDSPPSNWVERVGDNFDQLAGWGRWSPGNQLKRAGIGGVPSGISSFGFGVGGSPTPVKLEGAAQIGIRIEVSSDNELVVRRVLQTIDARGALRADVGRSMPETTPGAWNGE